jgi:CSLREA domain-containing protein
MKTETFRFLLLITLIFGLLTLSTPAHAAGIVVTSSLDTTAVDGDCTLREAIQNANDNAATNADCAAGSGADTITFSKSGTITLVGSQLPNITAAGGPLTIGGHGQTVTISGDNSVRVMQVDVGASLTLFNSTITNGKTAGSGGGIYNSGTLTVTSSTFSGNTAGSWGGGIENFGKLTITSSTFSGNSATGGSGGGGILNAGTLTITNSAFSGNNAASGGGIDNTQAH